MTRNRNAGSSRCSTPKAISSSNSSRFSLREAFHRYWMVTKRWEKVQDDAFIQAEGIAVGNADFRKHDPSLASMQMPFNVENNRGLRFRPGTRCSPLAKILHKIAITRADYDGVLPGGSTMHQTLCCVPGFRCVMLALAACGDHTTPSGE